MPRSLDDVFPLDGGAVNLTVSVASNRVALPSGQPTVRVANLGALPVFMNVGDASVTASVGNMAIAGNWTALFQRKLGVTHLAGISSSSIVTLNISTGEGKFS